MSMNRPPHTMDRGFIALTSSVVIAAALLGLVFGSGTPSFYARFGFLHGEFKRVALGLSESCANAALLKIAQDYNYAPPLGGETVSVGPDTCVIKSVACVDSPCEDPVTHRKRL